MVKPDSAQLARYTLIIALGILFFHAPGVAQNKTADRELLSLQTILKSAPDDTSKVGLLIKIGDRLRSHLPDAKDSALAFFHKKQALGKLYSDSSIAHSIKGALPYYEQAISLGKKMRYDSGVIKGMIGRAKAWIDLSQLGKTKSTDSLDGLQIKHHIHQIIDFVKSKKNDRSTAAFYYKLAGLFPPETSGHEYLIRILYDSSAHYYKKLKDPKMESQALAMTAHYHIENREFEQGVKVFQKSIDVANTAGLDPPVAAYTYIGSDFVQKGDYKSGLTYMQNAYRLSAKDSLSSNADAVFEFAYVCLGLGIVNHRMNNVPLSLKYNRTAMRLLEPLVQRFSGEFISSIGNSVTDLLILKRSQEALDLMQRVKKNHPGLKSSHQYYVVMTKFMQVYHKLNNHALAQKYCDSLITYSEQAYLFNAKRYVYRNVADFLTDTKQYEKARKYALLFRSMLKNEKDFIAKCYYILYKIDSAQGNFKSALSYYRQHKLLQDSLINETRVKEQERLNVEFDTRNREQQLELARKDAELSGQQLREAEIRSNIIIGGFAVALVILALVYRLYRVKKKSGELLQSQRDEIATKNLALGKAVQEKEWLLKEVNHRVKNNLYMISGLLSMQARDTKDEVARTAIISSQNRVHAMSIVHQKLLSDSRISLVDFSSYLHELVDQLKDSYDTRKISFQVFVEPVIFDARTAISLGLISNEAITNSIKYAFPNDRTGTVLVSLNKTTGNFWELTVQDDGVGISTASGSPHESIGMTLIEGIAEELDGILKIESSHGFLVAVTFPYAERIEAPIEYETP